MTITTGTHLGIYEIRAPLGKGGMGEVYRAHDSRLDREVAIKVLPSEFAQDADRLNRFVREAKSASALNHPNIITIYEIGESDGTHFIATELIDGKTLGEYSKANSLNYKSALEIAIQVASALDEAHSAGIIHRDIKPDNVMVRANGLVKILDFGIAKLTRKADFGTRDEDAATLMQSPQIAPPSTSPGMIIGTATYMSPEQAKGKEVDARTDIFSFGVVLYEMLAGQLPFEGETVMEMIGAILKDEPKPLPADIPTEISKIISKCLRKNRDERYQTIKDVGNDLKDVKQDLEFQDKLERTVSPDKAEPKTQIPQATTAGESKEFVVPPSGGEVLETQKIPLKSGTTNRIPNSKYLLVGLLTLLLAVGGFFGYKRLTPKQIESIAVMPFVNESGNAEVEYLSDGITETLISSLSNLPNLSVKARSTVFYYKGKETAPQKIGAELKVQAVLLGRVSQRGNDLKLSLELVNTQTQDVIWSEQYNRQQADLVTLQSEIARDVSSNLKTKLSGTDEAKVTKTYTVNPEAYQLYLKGRFQWNKRTAASLKQAAEFYQQAIAKDAGYALAYAGLAETYVIFPFYSVAAPRDSMPQAKAAARRALELDESLAEAHTALGQYLTTFEWNPSAGEKELRRAIELNPNYATGHHWLGDPTLRVMKRFNEALVAARRAEELDPLSPIVSANTGLILWCARRYDEAIAQFKHALTLDPNFYFTRTYLAATYHSKGMYAEAIVEFRKARELDNDPLVTAYLARTLAKSGGRSEAIKLRDQLHAEAARRYVPQYAFALVYAALGDKDKAFKWLEKDFLDRTNNPPAYGTDPLLDDLRDDPRFADLMRRFEQAKMD